MSNEEINNAVDVKGTKKPIEIITKRPDFMSFEDYKIFLKVQKKMLKKHKKGKLVWLSKLEPTPHVIKQLTEDNMLSSLGKLLSKGETFKGKVKDLK